MLALTLDGFSYQYGVGSVVFLAGLVYAARQGYVGLSGAGLRNLLLLLGGLIVFMTLQGYLQYAPMRTAAAVSFEGDPVLAEGERPDVIGAPIDYAVMGLYLAVILVVGISFGRRQRTTKDFFFGGQRFSWWLIAASLVATLVGSYSFVKYGQAAYRYGLASSQTYLNDWALMPFLLFGWLPILYFSRVTSIPEYFGRRFDPRVRAAATVAVLVYLVSYIGVNLYTMGTVLENLLGWDVLWAAVLVASISTVYVTFGGQTSVIMTDLFQGLALLIAGVLLLGLGIHYVGGLENFWEHLPRENRVAFHNFNDDPSFPSVGIFWQDAIANSAFFYFLNQGILMRFMAARSIREARKAAIAMPLILMPIAACIVASGGWIARVFVHAGVLPEMESERAFYVASEFLATPGVFGLILAALTAALMSTVDTLITAVSAIVVNDVYRPYVAPEADEAHLLRVARFAAVGVTLTGIALVPVFAQFETIYAAHGAMTAAVTPPLVVALFLAVFWRRYTAQAALWTIVGGLFAIAFSIFVPEVVAPFAHGVEAGDTGEGLFAGAKQYKFMRALYGLCVSAAIGVVVTLVTRPEPREKQRGLVWGTVADAIRRYKGSPGSEFASALSDALPRRRPDGEGDELRGEARLPVAHISTGLALALQAGEGSLVYVSDARRWLGGLRSAHVIVGSVEPDEARWIELGPATHDDVVVPRRAGQALRVERLY
ncbi:MAG: sodium/solute symporter [Planctomycetota bacterium]|nr:sodium/solute symporter [Planctomycetota bacterium]